MADWMGALASQYRSCRRRFPGEELMIVFDIDGTILDMRHMVREVLLGYDRAHGTRFFYGLRVEDVSVHENQVERLLHSLDLPPREAAAIHEWYLHNRWTSEAILASHRPFRGVLDIIRWFQLQPHTHVGLNTGRPDALRHDTLQSLNALASEYRVHFESDLTYMNPGAWEERVQSSKADGIRWFKQKGYRVFAVVDNEPGNIEAMASADPEGEILFLHAETLFESTRRRTPRTVSGSEYDITSFVPEDGLPGRVQLVWHSVNDRGALGRFLDSPVRWGECDVRRDPHDRLVLRRDSFEQAPWCREEQLVTLGEFLQEARAARKSVKLDLKESGPLVERVLGELDTAGFAAEETWFNGGLDDVGREGFQRLAEACPGAVIQCPVDFLRPAILAMPEEARRIIETLRQWGINRLSLDWSTKAQRQVFERLEEWGFEVNFYNVPDLENFFQAALLLPRSLTCDFDVQYPLPAGFENSSTAAPLLNSRSVRASSRSSKPSTDSRS